MDDNSSIVDSVNARRPPKTIMYSDVVPLVLKLEASSIKHSLQLLNLIMLVTILFGSIYHHQLPF